MDSGPVSEYTNRRQGVVRVMEVMHGNANLFQMISTLHTSSGFPCGLYGRQKQGDEHTDNRNHDEQFDEREGFARVADFVGAVRRTT